MSVPWLHNVIWCVCVCVSPRSQKNLPLSISTCALPPHDDHEYILAPKYSRTSMFVCCLACSDHLNICRAPEGVKILMPDLKLTAKRTGRGVVCRVLLGVFCADFLCACCTLLLPLYRPIVNARSGAVFAILCYQCCRVVFRIYFMVCATLRGAYVWC